MLADLAGGIPASLPTEESFYDPETADFYNKYIARNPAYTAEGSHRVLRMMKNKLCDLFEGSQMVAGMHSGGSPLMETITMMSRYDLETLKDIAKYLAGFEGVKMPRYEPQRRPERCLRNSNKPGRTDSRRKRR